MKARHRYSIKEAALSRERQSKRYHQAAENNALLSSSSRISHGRHAARHAAPPRGRRRVAALGASVRGRNVYQ